MKKLMKLCQYSRLYYWIQLEYQTEKAMAPHSSTLAWKIPWTEEPVRLQSMGLLRVGHNWVTSLSLFIFMHWRRKWQPTPVFLPGESRDRGTWWAAVYGVAQSRTRLRRLSSRVSEHQLLCIHILYCLDSADTPLGISNSCSRAFRRLHFGIMSWGRVL